MAEKGDSLHRDCDIEKAAGKAGADAEPNGGDEVRVELAGDAVATGGDDTIAELQKRIEDLEKKLAEKEDRHLRLAAEFDNYRKRTAREFAGLIESASEEVIRALLDILDSFDRALDGERSADADSIYKGMELIQSQMETILKERGLEEIQSLGNKFDPELHEAVMVRETEEAPEDQIVEEFQKGYRLKGKVIRHAKVGVARPPEQKSTQGREE